MAGIIDALGNLLGKLGVGITIIITAIGGIFSSGNHTVFIETYPAVTVDNIWIAYKDKIQKDGRTLDRERNYLTTSEGQSYSLLRAVWMDDKEVFDRVLRWTNNNLRKREEDKLFSWLWGQNPDGRWDVLREEGGINTASDADQDIALALIFAYKRWNQEHYLKQARQILDDMWKKEVIMIKERPYLVAGNWAAEEPHPTINPSYFSFAAYPIFAVVDPTHPWLELKSTSYEVLNEATESALDEPESANVPPDWVSLNRVTGKVTAPVHKDKMTHFSDDAFRVLWRVALDWEWHKDERAMKYLKKLTFLEKEWNNYRALFSLYTHSGESLRERESSSLYGGALAHFGVINSKIAGEIYKEKIGLLYDTDTESLRDDLGYYPQNWVWFGMAFYAKKLPNLFAL